MSPGSARRALSVGAALLALLAVVALASRGHLAGAGGGGTRNVDVGPVAEYFLILFGLGALLLIPGIAVVARKAKEDPSLLPRRGNWMARVFVVVLVFVLAVSGFLLYRSHHDRGTKGGGTPPPKGFAKHVRPPRGHVAEATTSFDWAPVIVVLSIAATGAAVGGAWYLRTRKPRTPGEHVAVALGEALDESLEDLRAEHDARRAVIAAYARMERALAASGVPRRPAEAPLEYMTRVLRDFLRTSASSVARLTALFERAKFSAHEIGPELKEEAIEALVAVREELRVYA